MNHEILVPPGSGREMKDVRQRLTYFANWLSETGQPWYLPDLDAYRDYLLSVRGLKPSSVAVHVAAVRARYRVLLAEPETERLLRAVALVERVEPTELIGAARRVMEAATESSAGWIAVQRKINIVHLSTNQIASLLHMPNVYTALGLRDAAIIGLMLCAGISETDASQLRVDDLGREKDTWPAIRVPATPGSEERIAPLYDSVLFDTPWMDLALNTLQSRTVLNDGFLFQAFSPNSQMQTGNAISARGIQKMLKSYDVFDGEAAWVTFTGLDLRRTFARNLFKAGVPVGTIQANMGHRTQRTTLEYIGPPDVSETGQDFVASTKELVENIQEGIQMHERRRGTNR